MHPHQEDHDGGDVVGVVLSILFVLVLGLVYTMSARGAPPLPAPLGTPATAMTRALGQQLFFDPRLSSNGTVSCATCHDPDHGWADANPVAVGAFGRVGTRNSPTIINAAYNPLLFHDGRTNGVDNTGPGALASQCLLPLANRLEMGDQTEQQVINRLRRIPGYVAMFETAYGPGVGGRSPIDRNRFGHAVASFESTILSFDSPADRRMAGDTSALSPEAEIGYGIFLRANCMACHVPPLLTDRSFHNNGMEFVSRVRNFDRGRAGILTNNRNTADERAFKTPTLREVHRTWPYAHNGAFPNLKAVVRHYNVGGARVDGFRDANIDQRIQPLGLTEYQEDCLVRFLEAFGSAHYPYVTRPALPQ